MNSDVPRGCNQGILVFLIFINYLLACINSGIVMSADDVKIFASINSYEDCIFFSIVLITLCNKKEVYFTSKMGNTVGTIVLSGYTSVLRTPHTIIYIYASS